MSFKAKKLNIDLELDLTEYISENDGGILKTDKTDAESINTWVDMAIVEGEKLQELYNKKEKDNISISEISAKSKESIIRQIDYFYDMGNDFYKKIPMMILNEILQYINSQISPAKKKLTN